MRTLLINTPIDIETTIGKFKYIYNDMVMVPIGIAYIAAYIRKHGIDVKIIDQYAENYPIPVLFEMIDRYSPDIIGFTATTTNYPVVLKLIKMVKKEFPSAKIVVGGYHAFVMPEDIVRNEEVDFVIKGEGEIALKKLCHAIEKKDSFASIPGLVFKSGDAIINNDTEVIEDINALPMPAYDLLPMSKYSSPSYTKLASPVYQMIASRGCPFSCSYCINSNKKIAPKYRKRNIDNVIEEIEYLVDKFNAKQIQFWDPFFPLGKVQCMEFCRKIIDKGLNKRIVWNATTKGDQVDEEMLDAMKAAGCKCMGFAVESGVNELLLSVGRKQDLDKLKVNCRIARKKGFIVIGGIILGLPNETAVMTRQTIDYAKDLDMHFSQFSVFTPYPGTLIYEELLKNGEISRTSNIDDFKRYNQSIGLTKYDPIYVPKGRTIEELKKIQRRAYIEFYLRPKMVFMHLPHLSLFKLKGYIKSLVSVVLLFFIRNNIKG